MKKSAFSLFEILIVLAVIGVTAVLVLPTFMGSVSNQTNVTVLRSTFADVTKAFQQAMLDQGVRKVSDLEFDGFAARDFANKYFDVSKDCGTSLTPCFADKYTTVSGANADLSCWFVVTISNGASICLPSLSGSQHQVHIDTNGPKGPNIVGRDLFGFTIGDRGMYESGMTNATSNDLKVLGESCLKGATINCFDLLARSDWDIDNYLSNYSVKQKKETVEKKKKASKKG